MSNTRLRWLAVAVAAGMMMVLAAVLFTPFVGNLNVLLQDWLLRHTTQESLPENFTLVALDEPSIQLEIMPEEVGSNRALRLMGGGFPWSREVYAILTRRLLDAGARLVIFDLLLPSARAGDAEFAEVLRQNPGKVVLASNFETVEATGKPPTAYFYSPTPNLADSVGDHIGFATFPKQNAIRFLLPYATTYSVLGETPREEEKVEPFVGVAAARLLGVELPRQFQPRRFRYSKPKSVKVVPLSEVFIPALWRTNHHQGEDFKDRIVLVGATAEGLKDYFPTPFGRMAGPEIQLHALAAILRGQWLSQAGDVLTIITVILAAWAALVLLAIRRNIAWFVGGLIGGVLLWLFVCWSALLFFSYFAPAAPPLLAWLVCGFAGLAADVSLERRERGRLRGTLERYVSKDFVREIVENPDSFLQTLSGQRKDVVVLFSDLKGFTAGSEQTDPGEMVAMLNEYFGEMVEVVFARQGTLDKFIGDALMATWGCIRALPPEDEACHAVRAALDMKDRLAALNAGRTERGKPPWSSGIGICQGPAIFGNIGSEKKMDLTVIGDTVNLTSRVEGLTRIYGCDILVNERIAINARAVCEFLPVDVVRVKGRKKPEKLFYPYRESDPAWVEAFAAARAKYLAGDFAAAHTDFGKLAQGGVAPGLAVRFMARCEGFFHALPEKGWDGVWDFVDK
jgi:adenylate cyclase